MILLLVKYFKKKLHFLFQSRYNKHIFAIILKGDIHMRKSTLKLLFIFFLLSSIMLSCYSYKSFAKDSMTKYNINVKFDDSAKSLTCDETVTYTNNYKVSLSDLVLHLYPDSYKDSSSLPAIGSADRPALKEEEIGFIKISSVLVNDKPLNFTDDKQVLKIKLDSPLETGKEVNIKINFSVKIPLGTDRLGYTNEVYSITNWYPIMSIYDETTNTWDENEYNPVGESNYSDTSDYTVALETPKNIITASTGVVTDSKITDDKKVISITADKVRDFVFMMSKYFKVLTAQSEGITFNSYYIYDDNSKDTEGTAKEILNTIVNSAKFYSKNFGKYPYPELDAVETYLSGGAMEYPTLIQLGKYQKMPEEVFKDHTSWLEDAAAHETGHQWWYVAVGNNEFKEPIMDESINTFSTAYYFEKEYGKYCPAGITMKIRNNLVDGKTIPINSSVDKYPNWSEYQKTIYQRGPEIFEDLRERLGDEKFLQIIQTYFSRFEFKNGSIKDFANVIGELADSKTKAYFEEAINSDSYYPSNLALSNSEKKHVENIDIMNDIQYRDSHLGLTISSMLLRGMQGETINLVIPSKLNSNETKQITTYVNEMKSNLEKYFDIKVSVLKDNQVSSKQMGDNLIVLGNQDNNIILKDDNSSLPLKVSAKGAVIKNNKISIKNLTGIYLIKNPKNTKNLLMVIYWKDTMHKYDFTLDNLNQYIINYSTFEEIRGQL